MGLFVLSFSAAIFLFSIQRGLCAQIIGGRESDPHSRPFMAALGNSTYFLCGGTLIERNWVLTAAHCFPKDKISAILGAHVRKNSKEKTRQEIKITNVFVYPGYNIQTYEHDIMLLKLQKKAELTRYVKRVHLPSQKAKDVKPRTNCLVAGWGRTQLNIAKNSDTLREVNVTVLTCSKYYKRSTITDNMMCAGDGKGKKSTCRGDSGGPLICGVEQRGIVSFGLDCGHYKHPTVYTRLTKDYLSWIMNTVRENP